MPSKISDKKKKQIKIYRQEFYKLQDISEIVGVSLYSAHKYGKLGECCESLKYDALGSLINGILSSQGINQNKLADIIGVKRQTISQYKYGRIFPDRKILKKLFSTAGVDYNTLDEFIEKEAMP